MNFFKKFPLQSCNAFDTPVFAEEIGKAGKESGFPSRKETFRLVLEAVCDV